MAVLIGPRFARNGLQFESCYHVADSSSSHQSGLYLGYLRGRSFPPPKKNALQKMLLSLWYLGKINILEKLSRQDKVIAQTVTFLTIVSQNAPDCISEHIHFKTLQGGRGGGLLAPGPPMEACCLCPLGTSPPKDKS